MLIHFIPMEIVQVVFVAEIADVDSDISDFHPQWVGGQKDVK